MKTFTALRALILLPALGNMLCQQTGSPAKGSTESREPRQYAIHSGIFPVELTENLHSAKAQVGEEVTAVLEKDLLRSGKVFAAVGSTVVGHVSEVKAAGKLVPESRLRIVFTKVVNKNGDEILFTAPAVVLAVAPDKRSVPTKRTVRSVNGPTVQTFVFDDGVDPKSFELVARGSHDSSLGQILTPTARGVLYLKGLKLNDDPAGLIIAKDENVILEYGTQLLIMIK